MKTQFLIAALAGLAAASPVAVSERQLWGGSDGDELRDDACKDITFIFARGSTERGLLGGSVGPDTCDGLKSEFRDRVACQGVGPSYTAGIGDNALPAGTTSTAIAEAISLFELAHTKCPNTQIVASGYSQGAAVMHGAIPRLSAAIKAQIAAAVLFGDTRNQQDRERIPDFDTGKTLIICNTGDLVCSGTLILTLAHFTYGSRVDDAVEFAASRIN